MIYMLNMMVFMLKMMHLIMKDLSDEQARARRGV